jgi:hypothetical protein
MNHPQGRGGDTSEPIPHIDGDLCRDLLNGFLSSHERERALTHIAGCSTCEKLFAEGVVERERLRAVRRLRSEPGGELVIEKLGETGPERGLPLIGQTPEDVAGKHVPLPEIWTRLRDRVRAGWRRPRYEIVAGLATAAAVLFVILWPHQPRDLENDRLRWLPFFFDDLQVRAEAGRDVSEDLIAAFDAYADHDAPTATRLLRGTEATGQLETLRKIYLGSALAWEGNYDEAVAVLHGVRAQTLPDPWGSETRWTLFVALRASGQDGAADSLLAVLAGERGEVAERARRLRQR